LATCHTEHGDEGRQEGGDADGKDPGDDPAERAQ
jgi:hypothetical protein